GRELVFSCVGNDDDIRAVMFGAEGVLSATTPGGIVVDHTTSSAGIAQELYATARAAGIAFLDAPVSGGQAGAESGKLTIMLGGDADVVAKAEPVMQSYARSITHIGPAGSGQLAKMVNQICIAGVVQGLAEGLDFALRAGLDPALVVAAISNGAAQSWQMDNRWQSMVNNEFDFGFAVDWMRKDLGFALREAENNGANLELTRLVDRFYGEVQALGGARWDTSSLIARLREP
ncbi:MAG TPA: NAD(P)-dependent oxidoreductase, partial [Woeseiaceae bacterium]|nr:NAD(P)-dependent oxidoreductase [Woeseiaceae bacterium]